MRLYWNRPKSQHIPHDQKILLVEFSNNDKNFWPYGYMERGSKYFTAEWSPTYEEILAILRELLKGPD